MTDVADTSLLWLSYALFQLVDAPFVALESTLEYVAFAGLVLWYIGRGLYCWLGYAPTASDTY